MPDLVDIAGGIYHDPRVGSRRRGALARVTNSLGIFGSHASLPDRRDSAVVPGFGLSSSPLRGQHRSPMTSKNHPDD